MPAPWRGLAVRNIGFARDFELEAQRVTALRDGDVRFNVIEIGPELVVDIVELAGLHVEAIAALDVALGRSVTIRGLTT